MARNALDERLDDVEYASKLLDGQLEHAELYSRVFTRATQGTYTVIGCTRDRTHFTWRAHGRAGIGRRRVLGGDDGHDGQGYRW